MPLDVRPWTPPPLGHAVAVAGLGGRRAVAFQAAGLAATLRFGPPAPIDGKAATLRLRAGGEDAILRVPAALAALLLDAAEPAPTGPHDEATAALLLEWALADALDALERALGVAVTPLRLEDGAATLRGGIAVGLRIALAPRDGEPREEAWRGLLLLPLTSFGRVSGLVRRTALEPACPPPPALVCVRVGLVRLAASVVRTLEPGDAVIPDRLLWPDAALVVVGERRTVLARLDVARPDGGRPDGARIDGMRLVLDTPPAPLGAEWRDWVVPSDSAGEGEAGSGGEPDAQAIAPMDAEWDDLLVTLVFELGRRTMPMAEVVALGAGHVIELGGEGAAVTVLANGARLGRGEIVRVGDALGIRLTQIGAAR